MTTGTIHKQIWYRTDSTNDFETYVRTKNETWSDWQQYLTKNELKKVLWQGNIVVKTTIGDTLTLNDMPDLSSYVGKVINFYFSYGSNALTKYSIILTDGSDGFFYTHHRDNNGTDLWMVELYFSNLKSTIWTVLTRFSTVINSDNSMRIDNVNHNLRLYRVEVEV